MIIRIKMQRYTTHVTTHQKVNKPLTPYTPHTLKANEPFAHTVPA